MKLVMLDARTLGRGRSPSLVSNPRVHARVLGKPKNRKIVEKLENRLSFSTKYQCGLVSMLIVKFENKKIR